MEGGGEGKKYHVTKGLAELIVFFLPNYDNYTLLTYCVPEHRAQSDVGAEYDGGHAAGSEAGIAGEQQRYCPLVMVTTSSRGLRAVYPKFNFTVKCFLQTAKIRAMDPNTLNFDLDPEFWPNLDSGSRVMLLILTKNNHYQK